MSKHQNANTGANDMQSNRTAKPPFPKKIEEVLDKNLPIVPIVNYFGVMSTKTLVQLK